MMNNYDNLLDLQQSLAQDRKQSISNSKKVLTTIFASFGIVASAVSVFAYLDHGFLFELAIIAGSILVFLLFIGCAIMTFGAKKMTYPTFSMLGASLLPLFPFFIQETISMTNAAETSLGIFISISCAANLIVAIVVLWKND